MADQTEGDPFSAAAGSPLNSARFLRALRAQDGGGNPGTARQAALALQNIQLRRSYDELRASFEDLRASHDELQAQVGTPMISRSCGAGTPRRKGLPPLPSVLGEPARRSASNKAGSSALVPGMESVVAVIDDASSCARQPAVRLRHLYASPLSWPGSGIPALQRLDIDAEIQDLQEALSGSMELEPEIASVTSLSRAVMEANQWIHISAHSLRGGMYILLEDDVGAREPCPLAHGDLERLFASGGRPRTPFVFLSACESARLARALHGAGVPHVVFCPTIVGDRRARDFASSLYSALAKQMSLEHAFSIARCAAELSGDEAQYGLLSDGSLRLVQHPLPQLPPVSSVPRHLGLKRRVENFVGRAEVFRAVLYYLRRARQRVVLLHCEAPLGLSATLREIAHLVAVPASKPVGQSSCAFFPGEAPGGLLIVDDLDNLIGREQEKIEQHLESDGAQLLASCHSVDGSSVHFDDKPMYVKLPPLEATEAAELFLLRCQRRLLIEDLLPPQAFAGRSPKDVCERPTAIQLLAKPVQAFGGIPGKICAAVDKWVRKGMPCLHGDPGKLASSCTRVEGRRGPRWM